MSEADLRCYHHPEREATSQCDRCGDYLCSDCVTEHDESYVCARCLKDITPIDEIGKSAKIACVINALACSFWPMAILLVFLLIVPESALDQLMAVSMIMSLAAAWIALIGMRGKAGGELLFSWSVATSAGSSAFFIAVVITAFHGILVRDEVLLGGGSLMLLPASVVLLVASVRKKAKPVWALVVALLAPLMFGVCLLYVIVGLYL